MYTPCEEPVVDFLATGGDCVDMGKRVGKMGRKGRECCGRGRREQKIERKKRSRVRIEVHTRMAKLAFPTWLASHKTRRDGRRQRGWKTRYGNLPRGRSQHNIITWRHGLAGTSA